MRTISLKQSIEIMGEESVIGPEDIQNTFGFTPENIPPIPFSQAELIRAKELGHRLIVQVNAAGGKPFTLYDIKEGVGDKTSDGQTLFYNHFYHLYPANPSIRPGWRLTSPEIIEGTTSKNYIEQTESLIAYLRDKVFRDQDIPDLYLPAINQFEAEEESLRDLFKDVETRIGAARYLNDKFTINKIIRESVAEVIYRLILTERKDGTRDIENVYTWTNSITLPTERFAFVGLFDSFGLFVSRHHPKEKCANVGTCFSRSGW